MITRLERKNAPLVSLPNFFLRVAGSFAIGIAITLFSLLLGTFGYWYYAESPWIDSLHNASMILSGMGPVIEIKSQGGKLFSTFYALYCGIVYLSMMGIMLAPFYHRMLHHFHFEDEETEKKKGHK
ncbi:MAG: hypothetical protein DWI28_03835 [Planctomycetota bacterium]|nr:MAG: hypothetical protein DWI28_03835 [Planctomycetota bacterium]